MDADRFDTLLRFFSTAPSRRVALRLVLGSALGGALGWLSDVETEAGKKGKKGKGKSGGGGGGNKKRNRKKNRDREQPPPPPPPQATRSEPCGEAICSGGSFCCDDERAICCASGSSCCNVGPGTGSCCPSPSRCAKPVGNDDAPFECCPPERQFTGFGVIRCCPGGTRSLGTEISSDDGPCCPEEKYCSDQLTGGKCCPDVAPICLNRATEQCCDEEHRCGDNCCSGSFSECCNGRCWHEDFGPWTECGDTCCQDGMECCTSGGLSICCSQGMTCSAPCGELDIACCTPEALANGACCNTDCGNNCGG